MQAVLLEDGTAVQANTLTDAVLMAHRIADYPRLQGRLVTATILPTVQYEPGTLDIDKQGNYDLFRNVGTGILKGHRLGATTRYDLG